VVVFKKSQGREAIWMLKVLGAATIIIGLLAFVGNSSADEFYKWVDTKGTIHFSDNPTSGFLHSQYKEKLIIKDGSVQNLGKMSFGERKLPDDQLLIYYKSEGSGYRGRSAQEDVDPSSQSTRRQAISSGFSPFRSYQTGGSTSSASGTRQIYPSRRIYPRKIYPRR
jgi:hypothetical protein